MSILRKRLLTILVAVAVVFAFTPLLPGNASHAITMQDNWGGEITELTFSNYWNDNDGDIGYVVASGANVADVSVTPASVLSVIKFDGHISITPKKAGTATVTVTGDDSSTATIKVTVTEKYMKGAISHFTSLYNNTYGAKRLYVWTDASATGTVKVKGKTYKIKTAKADDISNIVRRTIKLKSPTKIKMGTKIYLKVKYNGVTYKKTYKFVSGTSFDNVKASGKKIKADFFNLHKGDKIKIKYKGKTYTKKIKKNYPNKNKAYTFKVKKKVSKSATLTITITNKYKQTLEKQKIKLVNGTFVWPDPDEDGGEDEYEE